MLRPQGLQVYSSRITYSLSHERILLGPSALFCAALPEEFSYVNWFAFLEVHTPYRKIWILGKMAEFVLPVVGSSFSHLFFINLATPANRCWRALFFVMLFTICTRFKKWAMGQTSLVTDWKLAFRKLVNDPVYRHLVTTNIGARIPFLPILCVRYFLFLKLCFILKIEIRPNLSIGRDAFCIKELFRKFTANRNFLILSTISAEISNWYQTSVFLHPWQNWAIFSFAWYKFCDQSKIPAVFPTKSVHSRRVWWK